MSGRQRFEREQPWTPYADDASGPQHARTFAQDSVAEAFLSGTPIPQRQAPQRNPEPPYELPGPQAAAAPPAAPPAEGWTRAPRVVGPPRPADPDAVDARGEQESADPDTQETDVFLVMGPDRRARADKKEGEGYGAEREGTAEPEAGTPVAEPAAAPEPEETLLYRGTSLFELKEERPPAAVPAGHPPGDTVRPDAEGIAAPAAAPAEAETPAAPSGVMSERAVVGTAGGGASAFLTGRGAGSFAPLYAAPGGYEQRLAAVKSVPASVWKRAVFTVTRGRVNPG